MISPNWYYDTGGRIEKWNKIMRNLSIDMMDMIYCRTVTMLSPTVLVAVSFREKNSCRRQRLGAERRCGETGWKMNRVLTSDLSSRVCRLAAKSSSSHQVQLSGPPYEKMICSNYEELTKSSYFKQSSLTFLNEASHCNLSSSFKQVSRMIHHVVNCGLWLQCVTYAIQKNIHFHISLRDSIQKSVCKCGW